MRNIIILYCLFFITILSWFYFGNHWYPEAQLIISGKYSKEAGNIVVRWDSGNDLNGYEMKRFSLQPILFDSAQECKIKISKSGNGPHKSESSRVILQSVVVDGVPMALESFGSIDKVVNQKRFISLQKLGNSISFSAVLKNNIQLIFLKYNYAADALVSICGDSTEHKLYSSNDLNQWSLENSKVIERWYISPDGSFQIRLSMPRYKVNNILLQGSDEFSVDSLRIVDEFGDVIVGPEAINAPIGLVYQLKDIDSDRFHRFHPHLLVLQIIFAALTTLILWWCTCRLRKYNGIKDVFIGDGRYLFWGMLFFGLLVFSFWHIAFMPGIASTDSLKIFRAAHIPGMYLGDHPPLNVIFYQYLIHFWNNLAVVPVFQNIVCSILVASIYFSCYHWGVSVYLVCIFYFLTIFSIPIGLYNTVLWKDVPFAFLTVFLAFNFADIYFRRKFQGQNCSSSELVILVIVLFLTVGTRYNGVVYLLLIPFLIVVLKVVRIRWSYILPVVCALILFVIVGLSIFKDKSSVYYFSTQSGKYIHQTIRKISPDFAKDRFSKYLGVFDVNQEHMQWDHLHNCFWWRYNNNFLKRVGWNDLYSYLPLPKSKIQKKIAGLAVEVYEISYKLPWVYFSWNPVLLLYLLLVVPFLIRWLPMSAVFSIILLSQVLSLVILDIYNWRYYYFAFLGLNFLVPLMIADRARINKIRINTHAY